MIDWLAARGLSAPQDGGARGLPAVYLTSTGDWATLRLLGGPTWGRMQRPCIDAYVLRDRRTLRLFAACDLAIELAGLVGGRDVEIEICKGESGRVTVRTEGDIGWNAIEGPLVAEQHHCKTVLLAV